VSKSPPGGLHALIGRAHKLVERAQDVLEELGPRGHPKRDRRNPASHDLLDKMGFDPCDIDGLIARSGLTAEIVSAILCS